MNQGASYTRSLLHSDLNDPTSGTHSRTFSTSGSPKLHGQYGDRTRDLGVISTTL